MEELRKKEWIAKHNFDKFVVILNLNAQKSTKPDFKSISAAIQIPTKSPVNIQSSVANSGPPPLPTRANQAPQPAPRKTSAVPVDTKSNYNTVQPIQPAPPPYSIMNNQSGFKPPPPPRSQPSNPAKNDQIAVPMQIEGVDAQVSVDRDVAFSVGKKAVTSGAAGQLLAGTKPKMGPNGQISFSVDPKAAAAAGKTLHSSGATSELAGSIK